MWGFDSAAHARTPRVLPKKSRQKTSRSTCLNVSLQAPSKQLPNKPSKRPHPKGSAKIWLSGAADSNRRSTWTFSWKSPNSSSKLTENMMNHPTWRLHQKKISRPSFSRTASARNSLALGEKADWQHQCEWNQVFYTDSIVALFGIWARCVGLSSCFTSKGGRWSVCVCVCPFFEDTLFWDKPKGNHSSQGSQQLLKNTNPCGYKNKDHIANCWAKGKNRAAPIVPSLSGLNGKTATEPTKHPKT